MVGSILRVICLLVALGLVGAGGVGVLLQRSASDPQLLADLAVAERADDPASAREAALRAHRLQRGSGTIAAVLARTLEASEPQSAEVLLSKARAMGTPSRLAGR